MNESKTGLRTLALKDRYRSGPDQDVVEQFYMPAFSVAIAYSRAVGYFTSTSLALFARGLDTFTRRGGTIRMIASPYLSDDDIIDIDRGYGVREVLQRVTMRELDHEASERILNGLSLVGRLIANGQLDIKLAFVHNRGRVGIYHEKIGLFRDRHGDLVAFTGSSNETYGGLAANFESIEVYRSWIPGDGNRAVRLVDDFEALWSNRTPILRVEPFPDVAKDRLVSLGRSDRAAPAGTGRRANS